MTELTPEARRELEQSRARDSDFGDRIQRFTQEFVHPITPETDPKRVLAIMWALGPLLYRYTDAPFGHNVDPSTVDETAGIAIEAFAQFTGLDQLSGAEVDDIRSEASSMVRPYLQGFQSGTPEQP